MRCLCPIRAQDRRWLSHQGRAPHAGPGPGRRHAKAPRDGGADRGAAQTSAIAGWPSGEPWHAGRRLPSFGPFGPLRRRRALNPAADRSGGAPQRQQWRAGCKRAIPPAPDPEALQDRGQGRACGASLAGASANPCPRVLTRIQARQSEGWPGLSAGGVCSWRL